MESELNSEFLLAFVDSRSSFLPFLPTQCNVFNSLLQNQLNVFHSPKRTVSPIHIFDITYNTMQLSTTSNEDFAFAGLVWLLSILPSLHSHSLQKTTLLTMSCFKFSFGKEHQKGACKYAAKQTFQPLELGRNNDELEDERKRKINESNGMSENHLGCFPLTISIQAYPRPLYCVRRLDFNR